MTLVYEVPSGLGPNLAVSSPPLSSIERLYQKLSAPESPRTAKLCAESIGKKSKKLIEEAAEVAMDALVGNRRGLIAESADLLYHLAVIWRASGVAPSDIWAEMDRRDELLGIAEKLPKRSHVDCLALKLSDQTSRESANDED